MAALLSPDDHVVRIEDIGNHYLDEGLRIPLDLLCEGRDNASAGLPCAVDDDPAAIGLTIGCPVCAVAGPRCSRGEYVYFGL